MSEHTCSHPGCMETEETATMYKEPTKHNERGWFAVCGQHADFTKDGVEVIHTGDAAEVANAAILSTLQE